MAHKAWLRKRVKVDGKWRVATPVVGKSNLLSALRVKLDGKNADLPGIFILEWYEDGRRRYRPVGSNATKAQLELQYQIRKLADKAEGRPVIEPATETRHRFDTAVTEYIAHLRKKEREEKTIRGISQVLDFFSATTGRLYLEAIKDTDLTDKFVAALRSEGYARQTIFDRYARLIAFQNFCLKKYGVAKVAELKDGPDRPKSRNADDAGKKDPYTEAELAKLFSICSAEENLIWTFLLQTGCRERELMYATWKDINLEDRVFHIRCKEGFRTKDRSDRSVPFGQTLADALKARKEQNKGTLVFPNKHGEPWFHLIRILKKKALLAGLNCGHCVNSLGESCSNKPVCENWFLHRFRHSFAILHLRNGVDVTTIQAWMGHEELETTSIYLAKIHNTSERTKALVDSTFARMSATA